MSQTDVPILTRERIFDLQRDIRNLGLEGGRVRGKKSGSDVLLRFRRPASDNVPSLEIVVGYIHPYGFELNGDSVPRNPQYNLHFPLLIQEGDVVWTIQQYLNEVGVRYN